MDPETWFHRTATAYVEAQALFHLNQSGVVPELVENGPLSVDRLAQTLQLDERVLGILLTYLASVGELVQQQDDGTFAVTSFGRRVLERYSRVNGESRTFNLFDVRVGAWGPVWSALSGMLDKSVQYGRDIHRNGDFAFDGLFKLAAPLANTLEEVVKRREADALVELGPTSGLLARVADAVPECALYGVDKKPESLVASRKLAEDRGVDRIQWLDGDIFEPPPWLDVVDAARPIFFSCHYHEFLSAGTGPLQRHLKSLSARFPQGRVLIFEQPRRTTAERDALSESEWLYSQSNVLIHHLIRNARILSPSEWKGLFEGCGLTFVETRTTDCFAFECYEFTL